MNEYEKYLPLGSIILLKGTSKKIMIIGFAIKTEYFGEKLFDYLGCLYPEGIIRNDQNIVFNHEDIEKIIVVGYSNEEDKNYKEKLKTSVLKNEKVENN